MVSMFYRSSYIALPCTFENTRFEQALNIRELRMGRVMLRGKKKYSFSDYLVHLKKFFF